MGTVAFFGAGTVIKPIKSHVARFKGQGQTAGRMSLFFSPDGGAVPLPTPVGKEYLLNKHPPATGRYRSADRRGRHGR